MHVTQIYRKLCSIHTTTRLYLQLGGHFNLPAKINSTLTPAFHLTNLSHSFRHTLTCMPTFGKLLYNEERFSVLEIMGPVFNISTRNCFSDFASY